MWTLGISAYYHDSAAALLHDGRIVAAAQEERFTRRKHDAGFPHQALDYCLTAGGIGLNAVDQIAFYDKPFLKFERLLETYLAFAPRGFRSFAAGLPVWAREKLFQKRLLTRELRQHDSAFDPARLLFAEHHVSHAASAFFASPFESAAVLTMDGVGEWATTSLGIGEGNRLRILNEIHFPHSLGLLYSAFTYYLGFRVNSGEYKVMGLAPYGEPKYAPLILDRLLDLKADGSFRLDLSYFDYCTALRMTNSRFDELFGGPPRKADEPLSKRHQDIAASIQAVLDEAVLRITRWTANETKMRRLCLAGGVALNCVTNGKVLRDGHFDEMWIQPAAGDAGGSLGAALAAYHTHHGGPRLVRETDSMQGAYLGPDFSQSEIEARLQTAGARFESVPDDELAARCAAALDEGKALGWFQGRMEFGPRALGARSILADPRPAGMRALLNEKVKFRENFRPFAPAVMAEHAAEWFELDHPSPYMLLVAQVRPRKRALIPAVTHVDGSARVQTVTTDSNPRFHALLRAFYERTGCPVLINTSFNVRGEPVVCTPEDAFRCFMGSGLDVLAAGNCFLEKVHQAVPASPDYSNSFDLD